MFFSEVAVMVCYFLCERVLGANRFVQPSVISSVATSWCQLLGTLHLRVIIIMFPPTFVLKRKECQTMSALFITRIRTFPWVFSFFLHRSLLLFQGTSQVSSPLPQLLVMCSSNYQIYDDVKKKGHTDHLNQMKGTKAL